VHRIKRGDFLLTKRPLSQLGGASGAVTDMIGEKRGAGTYGGDRVAETKAVSAFSTRGVASCMAGLGRPAWEKARRADNWGSNVKFSDNARLSRRVTGDAYHLKNQVASSGAGGVVACPARAQCKGDG